MTVTIPLGDPVTTAAQALPVGSLVYLASYLIRMKLNAETTGPDTPNLYSADLEIQGDQGAMNVDPLVGPQGYLGHHSFPLRRQETAPDGSIVSTSDDLAAFEDTLTDTPADIGKYWNLSLVDEWGNIIGLESHIWWGTAWRILMIGSFGQPGPVPNIEPSIDVIEPQLLPTYPDITSSIDTYGTTTDPSWVFNLALPAGVAGPVTELYEFPDVDTAGWPPPSGSLMTATDEFTSGGFRIWRAMVVDQWLPGAWSMPENSFVTYTGVAQQAGIGSFVIPPQPWPWTVIVWGHLGSTGSGVTLSAKPLMIGCQVLLGDPVSGTLIGRGLGNVLSKVAIMPHYSNSEVKGADKDSMTPTNRRALVPANHTNPAQGTVYINLWNDGALGVYNFHPKDAQLFLMVLPALNEPPPPPPTTIPITVVHGQHCDHLWGSFPHSVASGNAVVMMVSGFSTGGTVTVHPPTINWLSPVTPAGAFPVWAGSGGSNCLLSSAGGWFISIWVLPDCPAANGLRVSVDGAGGYGWDAIEVSGLGTSPTVNAQNHGTAASSDKYTSGVITPTALNALILGNCDSGDGIATTPGSPWTTYGTLTRACGWRIHDGATPSYDWSGKLTVNGSWVSGVVALTP